MGIDIMGIDQIGKPTVAVKVLFVHITSKLVVAMCIVFSVLVCRIAAIKCHSY